MAAKSRGSFRSLSPPSGWLYDPLIVVRIFRQLVSLFALMVSLVVPATACTLAGANLTPAERACCVRMGSHCEEAAMPASHDCCHLRTTGHWHSIVQVRPAGAEVHWTSIASAVSSPLPAIPGGEPNSSRRSSNSLSRQHSPVISILRI